MSREDIFRCLHDAALLGCLYVTFTGGEALLREDIIEIVEDARKLRYSVKLMTSGTVIDEEILNELSRLKVSSFVVSLYSMNPQVHDRITKVSGSHERTIDAIRRMRSRGMEVRINALLTRSNAQDFPELVKFSKSMGCSIKLAYDIYPHEGGLSAPKALQASDEDVVRVWFDPNLSPDLEPEVTNMLANAKSIKYPCLAGHVFVSIDSNGDVFPCIAWQFPCGNIREQSFSDIWTNSPQLRKVRSLKRTQFTGIEGENRWFSICPARHTIDFDGDEPRVLISDEEIQRGMARASIAKSYLRGISSDG